MLRYNAKLYASILTVIGQTTGHEMKPFLRKKYKDNCRFNVGNQCTKKKRIIYFHSLFSTRKK